MFHGCSKSFCGSLNLFIVLIGFTIIINVNPVLSQRLPGIRQDWRQRFHHERGKYFEGDIMLRHWPPNLEELTKAGSRMSRWMKAQIPYTFHPSISISGRQAISAAMHDIESKTCIKFKPRRMEKDFVGITNFNQGCFSYVGRSGGKQQLNLGPGCWHKTTIIHELVHAIGFWHEQSRMDRDKYVNIQWNNIAQPYWKEFMKYTRLNNFGTEYDLRSVMHYSYNAFARDRRRPSIRTRTSYPLRLLGTGDKLGGLTEIDALQINRMYNCSGEVIIDQRKKMRG